MMNHDIAINVQVPISQEIRILRVLLFISVVKKYESKDRTKEIDSLILADLELITVNAF